MVRPVPSSSSSAAAAFSLSLPLLAAGVAAAIAVFFSLCISHHKKSTSSPRSQPPTPKPPSPSPSDEPVEKADTAAQVQDHDPPVVLDAAVHGPIGPVSTPDASTSGRRLSGNLSLRLTEGLSKIRTNAKKEKQHREKPAEESVWMKTIILGERCKVPSDEEEEEEAAGAHDDKGKKRRNYHPRTPRSVPVSRTNSFAAVDAAANQRFQGE